MSAPHRLQVAILFSLVAVVGCRSLPEKTPIAAEPIALAPGEWRVTDQVIVLTDGSGTMYVNETFPDAKALTRSFVSAMPPANAPAARAGYDAQVVGFGGEERMQTPLAPLDRPALASQAAEFHVMGTTGGMRETGGTTTLHDVFSEARAALAGKSGRAALVVFSDGLPDEPGVTLSRATALVADYPGEVCIHAVQTGTDPAGRAFLEQLAGLTQCGSVRNQEAITTAYEVQQLARAVFVGPSGLPAVGAAGPCQGVVRLRGVEFAFNDAAIDAQSRPALDVVAVQLGQCPELRITVTGHTDAIGSAEYNDALSYRRARSTLGYLVEAGVDPARLEARGVGEAAPIASNDSDTGRAQNRRVELAPQTE